jgi:hypothetical protein
LALGLTPPVATAIEGSMSSHMASLTDQNEIVEPVFTPGDVVRFQVPMPAAVDALPSISVPHLLPQAVEIRPVLPVVVGSTLTGTELERVSLMAPPLHRLSAVRARLDRVAVEHLHRTSERSRAGARAEASFAHSVLRASESLAAPLTGAF